MRASLAALSGALVLSAFSAAPHPARAQEVTFLSTQMRPLEEAQRARTQILNGAPVKTTYVPEEPPQLPVHLQADAQGSHTISLRRRAARRVGAAGADRLARTAR